MTEGDNTRQTLLMRACSQSDQQAWEEFIEVYRKFIYYLLHRMNINPNDFDELTQLILIKLWEKLPQYDASKGRFRSWLSIVIRNLVLNYLGSDKRRSKLLSDCQQDTYDNLKSTSESDIEEMIEAEWKKYILEVALENISELFSGKAIEVFKLSLEGLNHQQISERLDIGHDSVKVLKSRVRGRCIAEVKRLISEYAEG